jgi:hypothetical protein
MLKKSLIYFGFELPENLHLIVLFFCCQAMNLLALNFILNLFHEVL